MAAGGGSGFVTAMGGGGVTAAGGGGGSAAGGDACGGEGAAEPGAGDGALLPAGDGAGLLGVLGMSAGGDVDAAGTGASAAAAAIAASTGAARTGTGAARAAAARSGASARSRGGTMDVLTPMLDSSTASAAGGTLSRPVTALKRCSSISPCLNTSNGSTLYSMRRSQKASRAGLDSGLPLMPSSSSSISSKTSSARISSAKKSSTVANSAPVPKNARSASGVARAGSVSAAAAAAGAAGLGGPAAGFGASLAGATGAAGALGAATGVATGAAGTPCVGAFEGAAGAAGVWAGAGCEAAGVAALAGPAALFAATCTRNDVRMRRGEARQGTCLGLVIRVELVVWLQERELGVCRLRGTQPAHARVSSAEAPQQKSPARVRQPCIRFLGGANAPLLEHGPVGRHKSRGFQLRHTGTGSTSVRRSAVVREGTAAPEHTAAPPPRCGAHTREGLRHAQSLCTVRPAAPPALTFVTSACRPASRFFPA